MLSYASLSADVELTAGRLPTFIALPGLGVESAWPLQLALLGHYVQSVEVKGLIDHQDEHKPDG
jgi:hypothetical protein